MKEETLAMRYTSTKCGALLRGSYYLMKYLQQTNWGLGISPHSHYKFICESPGAVDFVNSSVHECQLATTRRVGSEPAAKSKVSANS